MTKEEILLELWWLHFKDSFYKKILDFLRCGKEESDGLLQYLEDQHFKSTEELEAYFN